MFLFDDPFTKMSDTKYKSLDPDLIRMPVAPQPPPSDKLLKAVEDFYSTANVNKLKHA